jgi:Asp-tRNA(Asn)/Glu-tRNA(Gln) amidotransferase A subunit family amidase
VGWFQDWDAVELASAIRARSVSPVEAVGAALDRIGELDTEINACAGTLERPAREAARIAERAVASRTELGPLHGVPIVVKDAIWVAGAPSTMGSRAFSDFVAPQDATAVARLRAAGAIVVATTTNPEFLWSAYTRSPMQGVSRNPWRLDRSPGGSSGGSAAAIAAAMAPLALGSDAGGSIRVPAAFCGIVGLMPTHAAVPRGPGFSMHRTRGVIGPMTRSVRDAALALTTMAGPDPGDDLTVPLPDADFAAAVANTDVASLRVAWTAELPAAPPPTGEVREAFARAVDRLSGAGLTLEEAAPAVPDPSALAATITLGEMGSAADGRENVIDDPVIREKLDRASRLGAKEYYSALVARADYSAGWANFFDRYDLLLTPTAPFAAGDAEGAAPVMVDRQPIDLDRDVWFGHTIPANLVGAPAVSVPMGFTADGLPLGLQIMGPRFRDARCLALAEAVERVMPWPRAAQPA